VRRAALAALALLFLSRAIQQIAVTDFWWQLATGRLIAETGSVPRHDIFSYTATGSPWIEVRWLYYLFLYGGWRLGGPSLLVLAAAGVAAAALYCAASPSRRVLATFSGVLTLGLSLGAVSSRFFVRPEMVTYLLVPVFLTRLDAVARGEWTKKAWSLPLLQVLWVNLHTMFVLGPAVTWIYAVWLLLAQVWKKKKAQRSLEMDGRPLLLAVLVTAACWVNPYGTAGALLPVELFREVHKGGIIGTWIDELQSPFSRPYAAWGWELWSAALLVPLGIASFLANRRRFDPARFTVWAAMLYFAALGLRNVTLFGYVALWTTLRNLDEAPPLAVQAPRRLAAAGHLLVAVAALGLAWDNVTDGPAARRGRPQRFGLGVVEWYTPAAATRFLLDSGARPHLLHSMSDGSWLIWAAAGRFPVFIDGRQEVYGDERVGRYLKVATFDWDELSARFGINSVLINSELRPLLGRVLASPDWVPVYVDHREILLVRDIPEHAALIRRWRIDPDAPYEARAPEPEQRPRGWRRVIGSRGWPWHSRGMADAFLALGSLDNAARFLQRGLELFPGDLEMRVTLAQVYRARGERGRAAELLAGVDVPEPLAARGEQLLGELMRQRRAPR
jgi:hypothetical protein